VSEWLVPLVVACLGATVGTAAWHVRSLRTSREMLKHADRLEGESIERHRTQYIPRIDEARRIVRRAQKAQAAGLALSVFAIGLEVFLLVRGPR
jgi:hypothetical protein